MRKRDVSIDILKFLAVLTITNSHMEILYGKYSALATGGAIGDVLFFFASGFTILLGGVKYFDNYYKRRINRIYPTVFAWALMSCLFFGINRNMVDILISGGGWFVSCIMIYYVAFYFIKKYLVKYLKHALLVSLLGAALFYPAFFDGQGYNMYGDTYYKWIHYFIFMLQGAMFGFYATQRNLEVKNAGLEVMKLVGCVVVFYGLCAFKSSDAWNWVQVFSLIPLLGVTYYIYRLCNSIIAKNLFNHPVAGWGIKAIGGLCLEVYLVQGSLFTDKLNQLFPLNLLIVFLEILVAAYILRCLARIWAQTFKETDYDWKSVFKIV